MPAFSVVIDYNGGTFFVDEGASVTYNFTVTFEPDSISDTIDYQIDLIDRDDSIVKTLSDSVETNGQPVVSFSVTWDGTTNELVPLPYNQSVYNKFRLETLLYKYEEVFCMGIMPISLSGINAEPCAKQPKYTGK